MNSAKLTLPKSFKKVALSLIVFGLLSCAPVFASCVAVGPSATGSGNGSNWNNIEAYSSLAGSGWVRGNVYYLEDGNYGNSLSITKAASGTTTITLKKAQSYDYGRTSDGCPNDISSGWNSSTMGSAQAAWYSPTCTSGCNSAIVNLGSGGYIILDGNTQSAPPTVGCGGVQANPPAAMTDGPPHPSDCGILISDYTCTGTGNDYCDESGGVVRGDGAGIVWEGVEWFGQGLNSNGNNNSEPGFWFANGGTLTNVMVTQSYIHNMGTTAFQDSGGWDGGSFSYNYAWGEFDGSYNHGESVELEGNNGTVTPDSVNNNIWRDQQTNGDVVATDTSGHSEVVLIYDNVDTCSSGGTSTTCRHNDGTFGCFGTSICNYTVYNNTLSYPSNCGWNIASSSSSVITAENNVWYDCNSVGMTGGTGNVIDYNSYLNSGRSAVGSHDISVSSGAPNIFMNLPVGDAQLTAETNVNNRLTLSSPYNVDLYGTTYATDSGAAQYVSSTLKLTGSVTPQ